MFKSRSPRSNFRRDSDRDSSPRGRKSPGPGRYDEEEGIRKSESSDGETHEVDMKEFKEGNHGRSRSLSVNSHTSFDDQNDQQYPKDNNNKGGGSSQSSSYPQFPFKVLCVSSIHPKATDDEVTDTIYKEYNQFGEISVKIVNEPDEKVCYIYFRSNKEAKDAKNLKQRITFYGKNVAVEAAYESTDVYSSSSSNNYNRNENQYQQRSNQPYGYYTRRDDSQGPHQQQRQPYFRRPPHQQDPYYHQPQHPYYNQPYYKGAPPPPMHPNYYQPRPPQPGNRQMPKFPSYLHHLPPEDDQRATRTLFAGNLEVNITEEELRKIFLRFGTVEDVDIKRPNPGSGNAGNAYAFVRYTNLDMAHKAKIELSGQYIGKFQIKIGYGKPQTTPMIWVGGLGSWASLSMLEREFDRFGSIKKIDWKKGESDAYISFDSIDAATAAVKDMRGYPLGGPEQRIRTDYAGPVEKKQPQQMQQHQQQKQKRYWDQDDDDDERDNKRKCFYERDRDRDSRDIRDRDSRDSRDSYYKDKKSNSKDKDYDDYHRYSSSKYKSKGSSRSSPDYTRGSFRKTSNDSKDNSLRKDDSLEPEDVTSTSSSDVEGPEEDKTPNRFENAVNFDDICKLSADTSFQGAFILKNSSFTCRMHLIKGNYEKIEKIIKENSGKNFSKSFMKITQRLRLDIPKLDDVKKRIAGSTNSGIFLVMPISSETSSPTSSTEDDENSASLQNKSLNTLINYLKKKDAAGVISLETTGATESETGIMYAFPPCEFATENITKIAKNLDSSVFDKDGYLLVTFIA